jgi:hypothetical protein
MGNFINKEWSQHFDYTSSADTSIAEEVHDAAARSSESKIHRTASALKKRLSNIDINQQRGGVDDYSRINPNYEHGTPAAAAKISMAEFDPRSPSSDIVRTPIFLMAENNEGKKNTAAAKSNLINDPRSPAFDYNRTPIHANNAKKDRPASNVNQNEDELLASNSNDTSIDSSLISESSILLQQVPDNGNSSVIDSPSQSAGFKSAAPSNLPRHILQRKQVEKLNKKKNVDKENQD